MATKRVLCVCGCKRRLPRLAIRHGDPYATTECCKRAFGVPFRESRQGLAHKPVRPGIMVRQSKNQIFVDHEYRDDILKKFFTES